MSSGQPEPSRKPPVRPSIATRTGDAGQTDLLFGRRVAKSHPRMRVNGDIDELISCFGLVKCQTRDTADFQYLETLQRELQMVGGEIAVLPEDMERYRASRIEKLDDAALQRLDDAIARIEATLRLPPGWAMPGDDPRAAAFDLCRSVARRVERSLWSLVQEEGVELRPLLMRYVNRLSDYLWLRAREITQGL